MPCHMSTSKFMVSYICCKIIMLGFSLHSFSFPTREKNFDEFSKHLKGLVELYKLPGDK